jgi:DNA-binding NarL/FixJ family response regulator
MHEESLYAERALRAGAMGYVMKKEASEKFIGAIRRALEGDVWISEKMSSRLARKLMDDGRNHIDENAGLQSLSDREFEVFNLLAQGIGPTEIGKRLKLSVKTIETHREHIKAKLGLKSGIELTRFALDWKSKAG